MCDNWISIFTSQNGTSSVWQTSVSPVYNNTLYTRMYRTSITYCSFIQLYSTCWTEAMEGIHDWQVKRSINSMGHNVLWECQWPPLLLYVCCSLHFFVYSCLFGTKFLVVLQKPVLCPCLYVLCICLILHSWRLGTYICNFFFTVAFFSFMSDNFESFSFITSKSSEIK